MKSGTSPNAGAAADVVLFNINDDYFADLALRLAARGVRIDTIVTRVPERFRDQLPSTQLLDTPRFELPERILELNHEDPGCLSERDLRRFEHVEHLYLNITDRLSYYPTTVRFRVQLFRALLRYWLRFFEQRSNVGTTFDISAPHMGGDLVAFHVAKHFGIRTLFLERTLIANRVLLLDDYAAIDRIPRKFHADDTLDVIRQAIEPELLAAVRRPSPWSKYSASINQGIVANRGDGKTFWSRVFTKHLPAKVSTMAGKLRRPSDQSAFFLQGASFAGYRAEIARTEYRRRVRQLRAAYEQAVRAPAGAPYVLFALHLQPERSTCPQGGVYDDQLLAIETAAKALPDGYELYVKEHPRQFSPTSLKSRHYRDESFYRRTAALPRVRLMSIATETKPLIEGALATATTTGSAGWESLLAGKPCLAFGTPWYHGCLSCHVVRSLEDCRAAYAACRASTTDVVERDLLSFLAYLQGRLVYSSNSALFARGAQDYDVLLDNLTTALAERVGERARQDAIPR